MAEFGVLARRLALVACLLVPAAASAEPVAPGEQVERKDPTPRGLEKVDVAEHLGADLPRALAFKDELGRPVRLGDYFDGKRPVVLTFNYSNCPMLCSLMLNGFVSGLRDIDFVPGKEFRIVTVSIDPSETTERARETKNRYVRALGKPEAKEGWHFLTTDEATVAAYARALGFGYFYNEERKEYAHPSAMAVASPDGKIVRYLYGIEYPKSSLRLALLEASQGKIGNPFDRLVLYCFHYDSAAGKYAPKAANIMRVGGAISVLALLGFLIVLFRAEFKKRKAVLSPANPAESVL
jgi:protein SCO1/2